MRQQTLRRKIVESQFTLVVVFFFFSLFLLLPHFSDWGSWAVFALFSFMAYVMIEWNNRFQLLRIRSRMNSICFLCLLLTQASLHTFSMHLLPALALLLCYVFLFACYARKQVQGYIFHAFAFLSTGSLFYPPLLLLVLPLFVGLIRNLNAWSIKHGLAAFFALLLPYWLALPLTFFPAFSSLPQQWLTAWRSSFSGFSTIFSTSFPLSAAQLAQLVNISTLLILGMIAVLHFLFTAYDDKLRTRQFYFFLVKTSTFLTAFLLLDTAHHELVTALYIVGLSPFIAHFFTLARALWIDYFFVGIGLWLSLLAFINLLDGWQQLILLYHYLLLPS